MKFSQSSCCCHGCGADGMMEDEFFVLSSLNIMFSHLASCLVCLVPPASGLFCLLSLASCLLPSASSLLPLHPSLLFPAGRHGKGSRSSAGLATPDLSSWAFERCPCPRDQRTYPLSPRHSFRLSTVARPSVRVNPRGIECHH